MDSHSSSPTTPTQSKQNGLSTTIEQTPDTTTSAATSPTSLPDNDPNGIISPVYWQHSHGGSELSSQRHSLDDEDDLRLLRGTISLEDHTESFSETSGSLWARAITIADYVIVKGSPTGVGAYVVWNCRVETLDGGPIFIRKRYSEFDRLRLHLIQAFPKAKNALPVLPPKSVLYRFQPKFLEKRRAGLSYFLNCVMLNPEFAGSPIVKDFIFTKEA